MLVLRTFVLKEVQQILCAIYIRLRREDKEKQRLESKSIQNQKSLLAHDAIDHGWDIYFIYRNEDYSGAGSLRPDFNRMVTAAKAKKFQIEKIEVEKRSPDTGEQQVCITWKF